MRYTAGLRFAFLIVLSLQGLTPLEAAGNKPRLVLVAERTWIRPNSKVTLDLYLCNVASHEAKAPGFSEVSTFWTATNVSTKRVIGGANVETITHSGGERVLGPNSVAWKRVTIDIPSEPGNIIDVYVKIGYPRELRSNSVLLFCPPEGKRSR
jgi:hypothetical protein